MVAHGELVGMVRRPAWIRNWPGSLPRETFLPLGCNFTTSIPVPSVRKLPKQGRA